MAVLAGYIKCGLDSQTQKILSNALRTETFHKAFFKYANKYIGRNSIIEPRLLTILSPTNRDVISCSFGFICDGGDAKDLEKYVKKYYDVFLSIINLSLKDAGVGQFKCVEATILTTVPYNFDIGMSAEFALR